MKTFAEISIEGQRLYKQIIEKQDEAAAKYQRQVEMKIFNPDYLNKIKAMGDAEVTKLRDVVSKEFSDMVKTTVQEKRVAINQMLTVPPTVDQMNLLNSLQIQGSRLNSDEVKSIAAQIMGNYQAVHALQVMAEKAGIRIHFPAQYDYQQLNDALNWVEGYLNKVVTDMKIFTNARAMGPDSRCFLGDGWNDLNYQNNAVNVLDANEQTTPTVESRTLTDAEKAVVENLFTNMEVDSVMRQVMASPELRTLVSLHPEYGKLVYSPSVLVH